MIGCNPSITPRNAAQTRRRIIARTTIDADAESRLRNQIECCKAAVNALHSGEVDYRVLTVMTGDNNDLAEIEC